MKLTIIELCLIIITTVLVLRNLIELFIVIIAYFKSKKALNPIIDDTKDVLDKLKGIATDAKDTSTNIKGDIDNVRGNINRLIGAVKQVINVLEELLTVFSRGITSSTAFVKGFFTALNYISDKRASKKEQD